MVSSDEKKGISASKSTTYLLELSGQESGMNGPHTLYINPSNAEATFVQNRIMQRFLKNI